MSGSPRLAAAVVLLDQHSRVLLLRRRGRPGRWELPGGRVAEGEDPARAACRCAGRELGLTVQTDPDPLGEASFLLGDTRWRQLWLLVEHAPGTPRLALGDRFDMLRWIPLDLLDVLHPAAPGLALFAAQARAGRFVQRLEGAYRWSSAEDPEIRVAQWEQLRDLVEARGQA